MHPNEMPFTAAMIEALIKSDEKRIEELMSKNLFEEASVQWDHMVTKIVRKKSLFGDQKLDLAQLERQVEELLRRLQWDGYRGLALQALQMNKILQLAQDGRVRPSYSGCLNSEVANVGASSH